MTLMHTAITLSNPGDRDEKMTVELAEALIDSWKSQMEGRDVVVETLDLSCRVYPLEVAKLLCEYLQDHVSFVRHAILNDIIASLVTEEGLAVLKLFNDLLKDSPLVTLNLSDNALGIRGIELFPDLISKQTLTSFSMENDGISHESMVFLRENLSTVALKELFIYNNMIGVDGARETGKILARCQSLQVFRYEGCRPQPEGTMALLDGLKTTTDKTQPAQLTTLYLEGTLSDISSRKKLCQILRRVSPSLSKLRLYDCSLERPGCSLVLDALFTNVILSDLNLAQNEMGHGRALQKLLPILQRNQLTRLNLNANEITSEGIEKICTTLALINDEILLEELHLRENSLGPRAATALANISKRLTNLKILDVSENGFTEESTSLLLESFDGVLQEIEDNDDDECFDDEIEDEEDDEDEDNDDVEDKNEELNDLVTALSQTAI